MIRRIRHLVGKEFIQVWRDRRLRFFLFGPPLIQLVVYGYAINFDVRHVPTAVFDEDRTPESRALTARFGATQYFRLHGAVSGEEELRRLIDRGDVTLVLRIPYDFARKVAAGRQAAVQLIVDATDSNVAFVVNRYAGAIIRDYSQALMEERLNRAGLRERIANPIELEERIWFNENLSSRYSFIPGVIAMVVMLVSLMLTAMAVVREKEIGTIEQILVSPIRPIEFLVGKTIPFVLIALLDVALVSAVGILWFQVPFRGNVLVLGLGTLAFLVNSVGLGLLISTVSSTQQQAMMTGSFILTPAIMLSGLIFPIANMPAVFQYMTYLNPLRYFVVVLQGTFLRGVGLAHLWPPMTAMAALGAAMLAVSVWHFRMRH